MFLAFEHGGPSGNGPICAGCGQAIAASEACERIRFAANDEFELHRINGIYHAGCAAPFKTVMRALDAVRHISF